ncbi:MAG: hypothetical protein ACR2ID_10440 [Chthoniobacterales bacterium]
MKDASSLSFETEVTFREAYLVMFDYLQRYWESRGQPEEIGLLLTNLSLWDTESGGKEPMDAEVLPRWLASAKRVLDAEATDKGYRGADILLDGKPPTVKVRR